MNVKKNRAIIPLSSCRIRPGFFFFLFICLFLFVCLFVLFCFVFFLQIIIFDCSRSLWILRRLTIITDHITFIVYLSVDSMIFRAFLVPPPKKKRGGRKNKTKQNKTLKKCYHSSDQALKILREWLVLYSTSWV